MLNWIFLLQFLLRLRPANNQLWLPTCATKSFTRLLVIFACSAVEAEPTQLRVASFISPLSPQNAQVVKPWIESLESASGGALKMDFFPGGTLGRHANYQLKLLKDGVQDVSLVVPGYTPGQFPDDDLFELPMLMDNTLEASLTYYRMIRGGYQRGYKDTKLLSVFMSQPYFIHLSSPYKTMADLKGKKIRVTGYLQAEIVRRLGATPIGGIPATQIRENISRGLIDGSILGWDSMHVFGVKHVTQYHVEVPITYTPVLLLMNKNTFRALSAKQQTLIDQYSGEAMARNFSWATSALATKTYLETKAKEDQYFIQPSAQELEAWRLALLPLEKDWVAKNPQGEKRMAAFKKILVTVRNELVGEQQ